MKGHIDYKRRCSIPFNKNVKWLMSMIVVMMTINGPYPSIKQDIKVEFLTISPKNKFVTRNKIL